MTPPATAVPNPYPRWLASLGLFLAIVYCLFMLWEWFSTGFLPDTEKVKEYAFGSGSMLEKGGSHYLSAAVYSHAALVGALAGIPGIMAFWVSVRRPSFTSTLLAYTIWLVIVRVAA